MINQRQHCDLSWPELRLKGKCRYLWLTNQIMRSVQLGGRLTTLGWQVTLLGLVRVFKKFRVKPATSTLTIYAGTHTQAERGMLPSPRSTARSSLDWQRDCSFRSRRSVVLRLCRDYEKTRSGYLSVRHMSFRPREG